ncbi:hypothetical protein [Hymenobacter glacieicola]|uniref:Uncharacterized protein n=1 Tax=Hymenobacter glacieicola TaxID=1562124 RepID=A0ABQ1X596_9BACT|nr:hypothetical protein [Hymenobacter glacieicola]GGG59447.1 hypothetical protein GCM10011378_39280 [Hymenobacter glacieicola]
MITPKAFGFILKHFDEIDQELSKKMTHKRPWSEPSLTTHLCDLLDEETQEEGRIQYTFEHLQRDLEAEDNLFGIELSIETFEYNATHERYISQSDLGLRLVFDNQIEPSLSWTRPYFLQAKKLFPQQANPLQYSESSRFSSFDKEQKVRIELLNQIFGDEYVKYLLFNPRPEGVDNETRIKLAYLRTRRLASEIFDFTSGLQIHQEFLSGTDTLKAGIFITNTKNSSLNFGQVHGKILHETFPLSWFIAMNFANNHGFLRNNGFAEQSTKADAESQKLVDGVLQGNKQMIDELIQKLEHAGADVTSKNIQLLPKHTITLKLSVGEQLTPDTKRLKMQ